MLKAFKDLLLYLTSFPIISIFCWTCGTHCLKIANNSETDVLGLKSISWHAASLGSKKENSVKKKGMIRYNFKF